MKQRVLIAPLAATLLSACVPYPVYKTLQPAARATITNEQGKPVSGADVTLIANAYPYGREKAREAKVTTIDGIAIFQARREWRTEVLAMHGWEEFFWNWCIQRQGFETFTTNHGRGSAFEAELVVALKPGQSTPCPHGIR